MTILTIDEVKKTSTNGEVKEQVLKLVEMYHRTDASPTSLSGREKQLVAIH